MDDERFDRFSRHLGRLVDRRAGLRAAVAGVIGVGALRAPDSEAAPTPGVAPEKKRCRGEGMRCAKPAKGRKRCCDGLACKRSGKGDPVKRRCQGGGIATCEVVAGPVAIGSIYGPVGIGYDVTNNKLWVSNFKETGYYTSQVRTDADGANAQEFLAPDNYVSQGLAVGSDGTVYVVASERNGVFTRDASGTIVANPWWTAPGNALSNGLYGVAVDTAGDGTVYVTALTANQLFRINPAGTQIGSAWNVCAGPRIAVPGPGDHIYVVCETDNEIRAYDKATGADAGFVIKRSLKGPYGLAFGTINGQTVAFVGEFAKGALKVFAVDATTKTSDLLCQFPTSGPGTLSYPTFMTYDQGRSRLWVNEFTLSRASSWNIVLPPV